MSEEQGKPRPKVPASRPDDDDDDDDDFETGVDTSKSVRRGANFAPPSKNVKEYFLDWWATAKEVCTGPGRFYETMPRAGGFAEPSYFLAVSAAGGAVIHLLWTQSLMSAIAETALSMLVTLLLARGVSVLFEKFGSKAGFEETYRVMCFGSPPMVLMGLAWIQPLALIYMGVIWFIGLKKVL